MKIGRVYQLIDRTNNNFYIGSNVESLSIRLSKHKSDYRRYNKNKTHFKQSYEIIKNNDFFIEEIECINFDDEIDLRLLERDYILLSYDYNINNSVPLRNYRL